MNIWWTWIWCRRCAVLLFAASIACTSPDTELVVRLPPDVTETEAVDESEVLEESVRHVFYRGYLADILAGDTTQAAPLYREVLSFGAQAPALGAQSALRLARWSEASQKRREAMDFAVRASILGADLPRVKAEADDIRRRIATTVKVQDLEVRGPAAGSRLQDVSEEVAILFEKAEKLLALYHKRRLQPRLEALAASVRGKRGAMERAVRAYRDVALTEVPEAVAASEFRIASLYYDFSLALSFELPSELDPVVARNMRSQLRAELRHVRTKARSAYRRSLAVREGPHSQGWRSAAILGLGSVEDIILLMK